MPNSQWSGQFQFGHRWQISRIGHHLNCKLQFQSHQNLIKYRRTLDIRIKAHQHWYSFDKRKSFGKESRCCNCVVTPRSVWLLQWPCSQVGVESLVSYCIAPFRRFQLKKKYQTPAFIRPLYIGNHLGVKSVEESSRGYPWQVLGIIYFLHWLLRIQSNG